MTSRPKPFAAASATPRYARSRTYDLQHIHLALELDPVRRFVRGVATLRLAPLHSALRQIDLDLAPNLKVTRVQVPGGAALGHERDGERLRVLFPRPAAAGRAVTIAVAYEGEPRRGLYFVGPDAAHPDRPYEIWSQGQDEDSRHWFPCFDSPHEKATSEVVATVPVPYRVVSNGKLLGVRDGRRVRTFHWREDVPHPAYLLSIVVGEYIEVRDEADGVPLVYYVHPGDKAAVRRTFGNTPAMMRYFNNAIGYPYPYEKYAQTVVGEFMFGGMENVSATTLTDAVLLDATAALDFHSDGLIAHELAHQWWGNLVTCKEWSHAWLNEGFATYFEALFAEHHRGRDEFLWEIQEFTRDYWREDEDRYRRPIVERRYSKPIEIFDRHLYEKGALVLHMLRNELGDELFWRAVRHYVRKHQFQNVETADFKIAIEEATGRHLDAFFDQWVYGAGFPEIEATWSWDEPTSSVKLRLRQTQERDAGRPPFAFPLDIELGAARGSERRRIQVERDEQTVHLPAAARPLWIRLDPGRWILCRWRFEASRSELLAQLQHDKDPFGVADAAEGLVRFVHDSEVALALAAALPRPRYFVAKRAIAASLGRLGGDVARRALLAALGDRDLRARRGAVRALGELRGDKAVAAALRQHWKKEKSYFVRAETVTALARVEGAVAWPVLAAALATDAFRDLIRAAALRAIGDLEDERGFEAVLPYAGPGQSRWARDAAFRTLAVLGRAFPARGRKVQDLLEAALRETSFFTVLSAADALGKLGRAPALGALRRLEAAEVDGRLQKAARDAIQALGTDATPDAWKALRVDLDALRKENRSLVERLERIEAQGSPAAGKRRSPARRSG